jgi:hypothetical protein
MAHHFFCVRLISYTQNELAHKWFLFLLDHHQSPPARFATQLVEAAPFASFSLLGFSAAVPLTYFQQEGCVLRGNSAVKCAFFCVAIDVTSTVHVKSFRSGLPRAFLEYFCKLIQYLVHIVEQHHIVKIALSVFSFENIFGQLFFRAF